MNYSFPSIRATDHAIAYEVELFHVTKRLLNIEHV